MPKPVILRIVAGLLLAVSLFAGYYVSHYQSELGDLQDSSAKHLAAANSACASAGQMSNACVLETSLVRSSTEDAKFVRSQRNQYAVAAIVLLLGAVGVLRAARRRGSNPTAQLR